MIQTGVEIVWDNVDCRELMDLGRRIWHPPQQIFAGAKGRERGIEIIERTPQSVIITSFRRIDLHYLRAAFHKYRPSGGTSQKIDFVHILLIGSP